MTTVAWDGNTLAADTLYVAGTRKLGGDYEKILLPEDTPWTVNGKPILAVGFSGSIATIPCIKKVLEADAVPGVDPACGDYSFTILLVTDKKEVYYWNYGSTAKGEVINELFAVEGNHAIGSGGIYGLGVMAIKGDAINAVKAGIKIDVNSGGYIDVWSFETPRLLTRINPKGGEIISAKQNTPAPEKSKAILCAVNG
jgi:hypothetical protein